MPSVFRWRDSPGGPHRAAGWPVASAPDAAFGLRDQLTLPPLTPEGQRPFGVRQGREA